MSGIGLAIVRSWRSASTSVLAWASTNRTSSAGRPNSSRIGLTNFRDASTVWYIAAAGRATPATSAAAFKAPADEPTTRSKQRVSPSRSSAAVMPAETTPRIPPPSSTTATR